MSFSLYLTLFGFVVFTDHVITLCNTTVPQEIQICRLKEKLNCTKDHAKCLNETTVSKVDMFGILHVLDDLVNDILNFCCPCQKIKANHRYKSTIELYGNISYGYENSTFIYPILGTESTTYLYGRYFIPIINVDSVVLITPKKNGTMMVEDMIDSCISLLPLFGICLLMALASGFVIWLLDTWSNEEQFPRNIFSGVYEGFWWAFISMTTVGYGDKTPLSVPARIFGILWIIVGITICSMLTASLTSIITSAGALPSTHITGKKMIVPEHRLLEASYVLSNGGILWKEVRHEDVDYELQNNPEIHGLITDHITTSVFRKVLPSLANKYDFQSMPSTSRKYSYGMLVRDRELYNYIQPFFQQNSMLYETCILSDLRVHTENQYSVNPFHPDNGVFGKAVLGITIICIIFAIIGFAIELIRRKKMKENLCQKKRKSEDDVIHNMKLLLQELSEIKREKEKEIRF